MKPAPFDYVRADDVEEALGVLLEHGDDARVLAGGQSLVAMMNMRLATPRVLVDISRLETLRYIREDAGWIEIGASATQFELERWRPLAVNVPLLTLALPHVAHYAVRHRGTVCGSIAHADPSAELPLCLAVLGGEVVLRRGRVRRVLDAATFQTGLLSTAREADEMLEAVRFPMRRDGSRYAFREVAVRHGDFAIVALAAVAGRGRIRLGVGGVADRPVVREWPLEGQVEFHEVLNEFAWELGGYDDLHASAMYRRELVRRLGAAMLAEVAA